jgi:hypothetical protein
MHLEALLVTLALFVVLGFVGYAFVHALLDTAPLQRLLLAPVTGLCALTVPVATLNHLGAPVRAVGLAVLAVLVLGATAYYLRRRPAVPWRQAWPFAAVLLVALGIAGWPMALFGFDWVSFGNDDMTTYLLGGNHFFAHGFFQLPSASELLSERDPSWDTSFYYNFSEVRYASPLMLAWVMSVTGLSAGAAFMPMIVALHLVVIASTAGLLAGRDDRGRAALIACALLAVSANLLSGTLRQLLPQDFGLAVLAAAVAALLRPPPVTTAGMLRRAAVASLYTGTLTIAYPEVLPFFLIPAAIYVGVSIVRARTSWRAWAVLGAVVAAGTLLIVNENVPGEIALFVKQARTATPAGAMYDRVLFAEFLTPLVFPLLWGLSGVGAVPGLWTAVGVVVGAAATIGACVAAVRYTLALEATAAVLLTMLLVFVQLMLSGGSFGIFKLTMYVQPFLMGVVALCAADLIEKRAWRRAA